MKTLQSLIDRLADRPDRTVLIEFVKESVHYWSAGELVDGIERLSGILLRNGIAPGDTVVVLAGPGPQWIAACLATAKVGGIIVPVDTQHNDETLHHIVTDSEARFICTESGKIEQLRRLATDVPMHILDEDEDAEAPTAEKNRSPVSASPEDIAVIFYTSGTTGPPKGVPLTHGNLVFLLTTLEKTGLVKDSDRMLMPLPLHHVYPFVIGILTPLALGAPILFPHAVTGPEILRALRTAEGTIIIGVPRLYRILYAGIQGRFESYGHMAAGLFRAMLALSGGIRQRTGIYAGKWLWRPLHRQMGPKLRIVACGGAALEAETATALEGLGWQVALGYGLTETTALLTLLPPGEKRLTSVGRPIPGVRLRIDPAAVPQGEAGEDGEGGETGSSDEPIGEVVATGPNLFRGYRNLPEADKESFTEDGWFRTGDLGYLDEEGYLYLKGRASTLIVTESGENIQPQQIETVYARHRFIAEAGVLEKEGQLVGIMVAEAGEIKRAGLRIESAVRQAVMEASKELPSVYRVSDFAVSRSSLPRTRLGKIRRHLLAGLYEESKADRSKTAGRSKPISLDDMGSEDRALLQERTARKIWEYLAGRFSDDPLTLDTSPQLDLGIDSLGWLDLTLEISRLVGVELDEQAINRIHTVRDLLHESVEIAGKGVQTTGSLLADPEAYLDPSQRRWLEPVQGRRLKEMRALYRLNRFVMRRLFHLRVTGAHRLPSGPSILTPNHISYLDALVVAAALDFDAMRHTFWGGWTGVAFGNPVMRHISRLAQVFPIDPQSGFFSSLAFGAAVLQRKKRLIWFPEGGRSFSGRLQDFKPGIGRLLHQFQVPAVPVIIRGSYEAMPPGKFLKSFHPIRVEITEPLEASRLDAEGTGEKPHERIIHALRTRMQKMLDKTSVDEP